MHHIMHRAIKECYYIMYMHISFTSTVFSASNSKYNFKSCPTLHGFKYMHLNVYEDYSEQPYNEWPSKNPVGMA